MKPWPGDGPPVLDALVLGTRHGLDPDHLAAISELSSGQRGGWRGFVLGYGALLVVAG